MDDFAVIFLTKNKYTIVDWADYADLSSDLWHFSGGKYASRKGSDGKRLWMHKVIMGGPPGVEVDHINGDKLDNRRSNLRLCDDAQQAHNRVSVGGVSRFKGVTWEKHLGKWRARIVYMHKRRSLGIFGNEEEAAKAYDRAAKELFGEFAKLNFPD